MTQQQIPYLERLRNELVEAVEQQEQAGSAIFRPRPERPRLRRATTIAVAFALAVAATIVAVRAFRTSEPPIPTAPGATLWIRQFGSAGDDAGELATDPSGVYVGGTATSDGVDRGFLHRYGPSGELLWERSFGIGGVGGIDADEASAYLTGLDGDHAFVERLTPDGRTVWSESLGPRSGENVPNYLTLGEDAVFVAGRTAGAFPGEVNMGHTDVFLVKLDLDGREVWAREFGTQVFDDADGLATDESGLYLAFDTADGNFLRKYDLDGNELWTLDLGAEGFYPQALATQGGDVFVAGVAEVRNAQHGATFVRRYDANGGLVWSQSFETDPFFSYLGLAADPAGVYLAAGRHAPGAEYDFRTNRDDAFVRAYDLDGNELWTTALRTSLADDAFAVATGPLGIFVAGTTAGVLESDGREAPGGAFVARLEPAP